MVSLFRNEFLEDKSPLMFGIDGTYVDMWKNVAADILMYPLGIDVGAVRCVV